MELPRGSGNGGPGVGGNNGGDDDEHDLDDRLSVPNKARVFTVFLLVVVLMTFGGLCAAYVVTAINRRSSGALSLCRSRSGSAR